MLLLRFLSSLAPDVWSYASLKSIYLSAATDFLSLLTVLRLRSSIFGPPSSVPYVEKKEFSYDSYIYNTFSLPPSILANDANKCFLFITKVTVFPPRHQLYEHVKSLLSHYYPVARNLCDVFAERWGR